MKAEKAIEELKRRIALIDKDYKEEAAEYREVLQTAVESLEKHTPKNRYFNTGNQLCIMIMQTVTAKVKWKDTPIGLARYVVGLSVNSMCHGNTISRKATFVHGADRRLIGI